MIVTHNLSMDLTDMDNSLQLTAVQNDRGTRQIMLALLENGSPWVIPEDATVQVRYLRPDGTGGQYDTLADGSPAGTISSNVLQAILEPELYLLAGVVHCHLVLMLEEAQLHCFPLRILVQPLAEPMTAASDPILSAYHLPGPETAAAGQYIVVAEVDEDGHVTRTATADLTFLPDAEEATF